MKDLEFSKTQNFNGDWSWGNKFLGISMSSNYYVFDIMSRLIDEYPSTRSIVELGTHTGTFAIYLGLEGVRKTIPVTTFEITKQVSVGTNTILEKLGVDQQVWDVFAYPDKVIDKINTEPCYLICDGGDKKKELALFVPHLKSGSILSVHDWGQEVTYKDLEVIFDRLIPIRPEEWGYTNCQFASFLIK